MSICISPISVANARSFRECLDTVARERRYLAQVQAPALEEVESFVRDGVQADAAQFVALQADAVVGWADIFPSWAHAISHCGSLGMGVLPAYRGRGIGKRLLLACLTKARANGITRVQLQARADNLNAIRLYEAVGFEREAQLRKAMRFDGVYFDAVQMYKLLE